MPAYTELYDSAGIDIPVRGDWTRHPPFRVGGHRRQSREHAAGHGAGDHRGAARLLFAIDPPRPPDAHHPRHPARAGDDWKTPSSLSPATTATCCDHGMWSKGVIFEGAACIPLLIAPPAARPGHGRGVTDARIAELRDILPTLLGLAGLPVPAGLGGIDLFSGRKRDHLFGELGQGEGATRIIRDEKHKPVYCAGGQPPPTLRPAGGSAGIARPGGKQIPSRGPAPDDSAVGRGTIRRKPRVAGWRSVAGLAGLHGRTAAQLEFLRPARPRSRLTGNRPEPDGGRAQTFSAAIRPRPAWWSPRQAGRKGGIFPAGCGPDG